MAKTRFPFRLADQFYKATRGKGTPEEWRRVGSLIDRNFEEIGTGGGASVPVIDLGDGAVYTGWSKSWRVLAAETWTGVVTTLEAPGTTDTVVNAARNGVPFGVVTIVAGALSGTWSGSETFAEGDRWQIQVVSAGAGALGLTAYGVH